MAVPLISVLVCTYNQRQFIEQCLAGIARQTVTDYEVVITDDGSTDGTPQIIGRLAARDRRIKPNYFRNNRGAMAAVADAMARIKGDLLFCEGSDDFIIDERYFEKAVTALEAHPDAAGYFGIAALLSNEQGVAVGTVGQAPQEGFIPPADFYRGFLRGDIFVPGSSSMFRYGRMQAAGGFDYALYGQIDFLVNHLLPCESGIVFERTPVTCQRIYEHNKNLGSKGTLWEMAARLEKVEQRLRAAAPAYAEMEADWRRWRAYWMIDSIRKTGIRIN